MNTATKMKTYRVKVKQVYVETIPEVEFLEDCQDYWEEHFDDVVKDIKEYANSKFKKPMEDRR